MGKLEDPRFNDPSYLAAKLVVYLAEQFACHYTRLPNGEYGSVPAEDSLDFLSVGVVMEDPGDIEYRYVVICDGKPTIRAYKVDCSYPENIWTEKPVAIPPLHPVPMDLVGSILE